MFEIRTLFFRLFEIRTLCFWVVVNDGLDVSGDDDVELLRRQLQGRHGFVDLETPESFPVHVDQFVANTKSTIPATLRIKYIV